jgi:cytochrome c
MGELGINKIIGALLATALGIMALIELPNLVIGSSGHHGGDHGEALTLSESMCQKFAYCVDIPEAAGGASAVVAEVFDLGAALMTADLARGARVYSGQCVSCHTIDAGGSNGTGPNLHNIVGASKAHLPNFNYSAVLNNMDGEWTYEALDAWLLNPAAYARGTSMSFAGIRRDADRAAVIAYLAENSINPPPFPAPLEARIPDTEDVVTVPGEALEPDEAAATELGDEIVADSAQAPPEVTEEVTPEE